MNNESNPREEARRRKEALKKWDTSLNALIDASHAYMRSSSELLKRCPLNDTAPLEVDIAEEDTVATVPEAFNHVTSRLYEVALVEQQTKMSITSLVARRNRMAKVSAVSRLPAELLSLVFEYVTRKDKSERDPFWAISERVRLHLDEGAERKIARIRPEIILTWICQLWRDVALNLPVLWQNINFLQEEPPFVRSKKYLIRSQEVDLNVTFTPSNMPRRPFLNKDIYRFASIGTALPTISRWGDLTVCAETLTELRHCFRAMVHAEMPAGITHRIKSIKLVTDITKPIASAFEEEQAKFWQNDIKELHTLSLKGVAIPWTWTKWLTNLTNLTLYFQDKSANTNTPVTLHPTQAQFRKILADCPRFETLNLSEFKFKDAADAVPDEVSSLPPPGVLELSRLHTLKLRHPSAPCFHVLLGMFTAPNLESLYVNVQPLIGMPLTRNLLPFVERYANVNSPIRKLWLGWSNGLNGDTSIGRVLRCLPNLEEVIFQYGSLSASIMRALVPRDEDEEGSAQPAACPRLKVLRFLDVVYEFESIIELAEKRSLAGIKLDLLHIKKTPRPTGEAAEAVPLRQTKTTISPTRLSKLVEAVGELRWEDDSVRFGAGGMPRNDDDMLQLHAHTLVTTAGNPPTHPTATATLPPVVAFADNDDEDDDDWEMDDEDADGGDGMLF